MRDSFLKLRVVARGVVLELIRGDSILGDALETVDLVAIIDEVSIASFFQECLFSLLLLLPLFSNILLTLK